MNRLLVGLFVVLGTSIGGVAQAAGCDAAKIAEENFGVMFEITEAKGSLEAVKKKGQSKFIKKICGPEKQHCTPDELGDLRKHMYTLDSQINEFAKTACVAVGVRLDELDKRGSGSLVKNLTLQQDVSTTALEVLRNDPLQSNRYRVDVRWRKKKCPADTVAFPIRSGVSDALTQLGVKTTTKEKAKVLKVEVNTRDGRRINAELRGQPLLSQHNIKHFESNQKDILREQKCIPPGTTMFLAGSGSIAAGAATIIGTYSMAKSQNQIDPKPWARLSMVNTTGWIIAGGGAVLAGIGLSKRFKPTSSFAITPRWNAHIGPTGLVVWTPL